MRKLMSTPNIVFKGSGWAKKDARDARPAAKASSTTGKQDGGESSSTPESSPKGESTPPAKSGDDAGASGKGAGGSGKKESSTGASSAD